MTGFAIGKLPWDEETPLATNAHAGKARIPTGNNAVRAYGECRRAAVIGRGVKFLAVGSQPARVVDGVELGRRREFTGAGLRIHKPEGVGGFYHAMGWRNVLGQCRAGSGRMVSVHRRRRRGGLGNGSSYRREGEKRDGCAKFHVFDSTGVKRHDQASGANFPDNTKGFICL